MLSTLYPEYNWLPWKFENSPRNFWDDVKNQRNFLDWASKEFKIQDMSDWYRVTQKDLIDIGGSSLLGKYNYSPSLIFSTVYPEYEWLSWKFVVTPRDAWDDIQSQRKFFDWAGKELKVNEFSDWYNVKRKVDLQGREN
jgi:hypothetical protein